MYIILGSKGETLLLENVIMKNTDIKKNGGAGEPSETEML